MTQAILQDFAISQRVAYHPLVRLCISNLFLDATDGEAVGSEVVTIRIDLPITTETKVVSLNFFWSKRPDIAVLSDLLKTSIGVTKPPRSGIPDGAGTAEFTREVHAFAR